MPIKGLLSAHCLPMMQLRIMGTGTLFKKELKSLRHGLNPTLLKVHGQVVEPKLNASGERVIVTGTYINNNNYKIAADFLFIVKDG